MKSFREAMIARRTIHVLENEEIISDDKLLEIVSDSVKYCPTAFNAQEQRAVVLLGEKNTWFWDTLLEKLRTIVPANDFPATESRINGFAGGVGTILIYQDTDIIKGLQEQYAIYADNFPIWAQQASGMLKYILWTSLSAEGYGASLQHYSELIEEDMRKGLGIADSWKMVGQIPFGAPGHTPYDNKAFEPVEKRLLTFK